MSIRKFAKYFELVICKIKSIWENSCERILLEKVFESSEHRTRIRISRLVKKSKNNIEIQ